MDRRNAPAYANPDPVVTSPRTTVALAATDTTAYLTPLAGQVYVNVDPLLTILAVDDAVDVPIYPVAIVVP